MRSGKDRGRKRKGDRNQVVEVFKRGFKDTVGINCIAEGGW